MFDFARERGTALALLSLYPNYRADISIHHRADYGEKTKTSGEAKFSNKKKKREFLRDYFFLNMATKAKTIATTTAAKMP